MGYNRGGYGFDMEKRISETTECPKNPYREVP
jgi:hypothetical protein